MAALTLKDFFQAPVPQSVHAFVDSLLQLDQLEQLRALYLPTIEADAAQFDRLVLAKRAHTIKRFFKPMKDCDPHIFKLLKPFRTQLGLLKDEEVFAYFVENRADTWKRFKQVKHNCETKLKLTADDLSANAHELEASRQRIIEDIHTTARLNSFVSLSKALAYDAVTLIVPFLDALHTQNHTVLAQAAADAKIVHQLQAFELFYLTARAETKLNHWLAPNDAGIVCRDELDVYFWLSAALLEHGATPTPGFSAVAGANPLAVFKV